MSHNVPKWLEDISFANGQTRKGFQMNRTIRDAVLIKMTDPTSNGYSKKELAKAIGITPRTLNSYLTEEMWHHIKKRRLAVVKMEIEAIDRAVYQKAVAGDLTAAKLIYARWESVQQAKNAPQNATEESLQTLSAQELAKRIEAVEEEIKTLEA